MDRARDSVSLELGGGCAVCKVPWSLRAVPRRAVFQRRRALAGVESPRGGRNVKDADEGRCHIETSVPPTPPPSILCISRTWVRSAQPKTRRIASGGHDLCTRPAVLALQRVQRDVEGGERVLQSWSKPEPSIRESRAEGVVEWEKAGGNEREGERREPRPHPPIAVERACSFSGTEWKGRGRTDELGRGTGIGHDVRALVSSSPRGGTYAQILVEEDKAIWTYEILLKFHSLPDPNHA
ncbi:hypothetical protein SCHPADRAFT_750669 [Schizopora paradoxa]|uniref:Uncharacterized protein n=1 Tax=Schizopora paradoxa TaxID=27342 RepID=A0A0H2RIA3_9AGAM|nr:hypothetical protein SCHPADRAFT_750669 [Schizopora paradoxa]